MANDVRTTRSAMRGLFIPDDRIVWYESQSTWTEAGPRPGIPTAGVPSNITVEASGSVTEQADYRLTITKAGLPSRTDEGCRFYFLKNETTPRYGWNPPHTPSGWEVLTWSTSSTTDIDAVDAVSMPDGTVVLVYADTTGGRIMSRKLSASGVWSTPSSVSGTRGSYGQGVALCKLPTGRLLLFYWDNRQGPGDFAQIVTEYSDDGDNWFVASNGALVDPPPLRSSGSGVPHYDKPGQLRACYLNGQILLVASMRVANDDVSPGCRNVLIQYASRDVGASFTTIYEGDPLVADQLLGAQYDCEVVDGRILVTWASVTGSAPPVRCLLSSPYESIGDADISSISSDFGCALTVSASTSGVRISEADCALAVDGDGIAYVYATAYSENCEAVVARSVDGGDTWETIGRSSTLAFEAGPWWNSKSATDYPTRTCAVAHRGQVLLFHGFESSSASARTGSLAVAYLGGWSSWTTPPFDELQLMKDRANWDLTWYGTVAPDLAGWTATGPGTGTLGSTGLVITTAIQRRTYQQTITGSVSSGLGFRVALSVSTGGTASEAVRVSAICADGSTDVEVVIRVGTAGIDVYDGISTTLIGTIALDCTLVVEIVGFCCPPTSGSSRIYARQKNSTSPQTWQTVGAQLTDGGATARSTNVFSFGHSILTTATSTWTEAHVSGGNYVGAPYESGTGGQSELLGRPLPTTPVYLDDGVYVRGIWGPGFTDDYFEILPAYDYSLSRLDPIESPSPRQTWRSQTDLDDVDLAYTLQSQSASDAPGLRGPLLGVVVMGANWSVGKIEGRNSAGTWSDVADFNASEGLSQLYYACEGSTVKPNSSSGNNPFFKTNELAGSRIYLGAGCVRKIRSNTAGRWSTGGGQQAVIVLDEVDGSEPATGTSASIVPLNFAIVVATAATQGYRGLRLYIEGGQDTYEGYFEIGVLAFGHVEVFADEYSWDRSVETQTSTERAVARDGTDRVRVMAPPFRVVRVAWQSPVDTTMIHSSSEPEPDFITASEAIGAAAVASVGSTPYQVEGVLRMTDSGRIPVGYLSKIPFGGSSAPSQIQILNRRDHLVWGRLLGAVSLDTQMGEELASEMVRMSQIEIEELT